MSLTIGKLRGLQQLAGSQGLLTMCALDHRGALKRVLNKGNPEAVSYREMVDFKLDLCRVVAPFASAVLLDPEYGAGQVITAGVLPGTTGLLVSREKTGYTGSSQDRVTELLSEWDVKKTKRMGASAVKLLIYYRPDAEETAARQRKVISHLAEQCLIEDVPLLVEPISYPREESAAEFARLKPQLVIETARQITRLPIDVLKAEFPADMNYESDDTRLLALCQELDNASRLPWVLLSAGVDYDTFKKQVTLACQAGASGFLAGRALWQEGAGISDRQQRMEFFRNTSAPRLKELAEIAAKYGKPWYHKLGATDGGFLPPAEGWYRRY